MRQHSWVVFVVGIAVIAGCRRKEPPPATPPAEVSAAAENVVPQQALAPTVPRFPVVEAAGRVVALGDVHGDLGALQRVLRAAGVTNDADDWIAGNTTVVQTGDLLDRGDDEQAIVDLLEKLEKQAHEAGGQVVVLNGNHEVMNVLGDLRYVTPGGFADFADVPGLDTSAADLAQLPEPARARMAALKPGGPYARILSHHGIATVVAAGEGGEDRTVFAHGGVLPAHVEYGLSRINEETEQWMKSGGTPPAMLTREDAPIWTRIYSQDPPDCATLERALSLLDADRMMVGHTVQESGVTSACDGKIWRIDVGMAAHYGGTPAGVVIEGGAVTVVSANDRQ